jgi:hypothetical protein
MIGALVMLGGITAIVWIVILLDERGRRIARAERMDRVGMCPRHASKKPV